MVKRGMIKKDILNQIQLLKKYYPEAAIKKISKNSFIWIGELRSSPMGSVYKIKLEYTLGRDPEVFVVEPSPLKLAEGQKRLPHVYSHDKQHLCLFYPKGDEWQEGKMIASTIIPWAIEWLFHYEIWLITSKWQGGGKHPVASEKNN